MAYEYQTYQNHQILFEDDELYEIKIDKQLYQEIYHTLIQSIDQVQLQEAQRQKIIVQINRFIQNTSNKLKQISQIITKNVIAFKIKIKQKEHQILSNHQKIESLTQTNEILHAKIQNWEKQCENLKSQNLQIVQKYQQRLKIIKKQKKQIKQTFRIVQQNTQIQRMLIENLQLQKQEINEFILNEKKQKQQLIDELKELRYKFQQTQERLIASNKKIGWQERKIEELQEQIHKKDSKIIQLKEKIKQFVKNNNSQFQKDMNNKNGEFQSVNIVLNEQIQQKYIEQAQRRVSFIERNPLSDQINGFQEYQIIKSFISVAKSDGKSANDYEAINKSIILQQQQSPQKQERPQNVEPLKASEIKIPNFYFAHFLLTCQSMKLKLNEEQYLWVDMSPFYNQIIEQKVPFHMWDEWIIKKLKYLANKK